MWNDGPDPFRPRQSFLSPWWIAIALILVGLSLGIYFSPMRVEIHWPSGTREEEGAKGQPAGTEVSLAAEPDRIGRPHRGLAIEAEREANHSPQPTVAEQPLTREIYLCKGYSGEMFWSNALCST